MPDEGLAPVREHREVNLGRAVAAGNRPYGSETVAACGVGDAMAKALEVSVDAADQIARVA
jgi:hypothetical protein